MQRLLAACRSNNHMVSYTTTAYTVTDRDNPHTDMGLWHRKIPVEVLSESNETIWAIDSRIQPASGEHVITKKRASAFHGTHLAGMLRAAGVDTILVTGVTASACVRATSAARPSFTPIAGASSPSIYTARTSSCAPRAPTTTS